MKKKLNEINTDENLLQAWKRDIYDRAEDVDPNEEFIWTGLAIAYFIGKGQSIDDAYRLEGIASDRGWV